MWKGLYAQTGYQCHQLSGRKAPPTFQQRTKTESYLTALAAATRLTRGFQCLAGSLLGGLVVLAA